ncbi:hypothetical protein A3F65_00095 [Candidatus Saccharibacteria bacterium RIFCSPHIGHO2_12_FULL_47_16b]|nr:MAG: hypothetical protein A3F65_00095 [Candidatus Saccharibacteria bacterium RIFCSPHIGHO2_12_FULL_47_16b]
MRLSREPVGELGLITYFGVAAAIALGTIFGIEAATDIDKAKIKPSSVPGAPICTIYNLENKWGDCTNSHSGGEWLTLPNGCIVLWDYNSHGAGWASPCSAEQFEPYLPSPPKTG